MTKFSIIVVSLNTKESFLNTINSIKKQKFENYEVIVVDGKSSDGTIELIKEIKDEKFKYIIEKDTGIYDAMNKGIKLSKGDWIIFLNSGDEFYNQDILKEVSIKETKNYNVIYADTVINNGSFQYKAKATNFTNRTFLMPFCHQSTFVRRALIDKFKFDLKYEISSDFNFFMQCSKQNEKFFNLNMIISKTLSGGFSDKNRNKVFDENLRIIRENNYSFILIFKLWKKKIINFIMIILKFIMPNFLILFFLKIKYYKFIIPKSDL